MLVAVGYPCVYGDMKGTKMKEHPIIMSGNHPTLILDGSKTQTRRLWGLGKINANPDSWFGIPENVEGNLWRFFNKDGTNLIVKCPYGQVGDRLWVRETWRIESFMEGVPLLFGYKDGQTMEENEYSDTLDYESWYERVCIQSTNEAREAHEQGLVHQREDGCYLWDIGKSPCRWRPSIFMPRWASRILLENTIDPFPQRLQEITEEDAIAEGCPGIATHKPYPRQYRDSFIVLWDSLNAKRGYGWETNPWVWCISFVRLK